MDFIVENWSVIAAIISIIVVVIISVYRFFKSDKMMQMANLKEWLLYATSLAEKELGSGTGKLKLRYVYDMFTVKFPWLAKVIPFEKFSGLVDEALKDMNELLATNVAVNNFVTGPTKTDEGNE